MAVFSPSFAEEILVHYILADLENKVLHQIFSNLIRKRVRRHAQVLVTQSFQRPSFRKNALI